MSDTEIPDDVKQQALDAAAPMREAMNEPATAAPVDQPSLDAPADMSGVPDAYDVAGQEAYRDDQRQEAIAGRDGSGEPQGPEASGSIDNLSQEDYDAMLSAGTTLQNSISAEEMNAEQSVPEETFSTPVGEMSQADYDAMLSAGQTINDAMDAQTVQSSDPDAAQGEATPSQEDALDLTPEPETPEADGPEPE